MAWRDLSDEELVTAAPAVPAPAAAPREPIGRGAAAGLGALDFLSLGLAPRMYANIQELKGNQGAGVKLGPALQPEPGDTPEVALFKRNLLAQQAEGERELSRKAYEGLQTRAETERPRAFMGGQIGGGLASGLGAGALARAGVGATVRAAPSLLRQMATGAAENALQGGLSGAGHSRAIDTGDPLQFLADIGVGGISALPFGAAGPVAGKVAGKVIGAGARGIARGLRRVIGGADIPVPAGAASGAAQALEEAAPAAPRARALPPGTPVPVAGNIEEALAQQADVGAPAVPLAQQAAAGGAPARLPTGAPAAGAEAAAGEAPPETWSDVFEAAKGGMKDVGLLQRLAQTVTPQKMMAKAGEMAPAMALKAVGGIKSDITKHIPEEVETPVGLWALDRVLKSGIGKRDVVKTLKGIAGRVQIQKKLATIEEPFSEVELQTEMASRLNNMKDVTREELAPEIERWMGVLQRKLAKGPQTIAEMNAEKAALNNPKLWGKELTAPAKLARKEVVAALGKIVDRSAERNMTPAAFKEYRKAKLDYGMVQKLLPLAEGGVNRERGNMPISLPSIILGSGPGASVGTTVGGLMAGPPGAVVGGTLGAGLGAVGAEAIKRRGASVAAPFLHKLGQAAAKGERPSAAVRAATFQTLEDFLETVDDELAAAAAKPPIP